MYNMIDKLSYNCIYEKSWFFDVVKFVAHQISDVFPVVCKCRMYNNV